MNEAKAFVNYLRRMRPNRNWPTPVEYVGGGADGKVYLTNSGKLMKIGLGSKPSEFRPLHVLKNTKFVPKFNQLNWAIVPVRTKRNWKNKGHYVKEIVNLFKLKNTNVERAKLKNYRNINKYVKLGHRRKNIEEYLRKLKHYIKLMNRNSVKKATVFLMNKIPGDSVMTLHSYVKSHAKNEAEKNRFRKSVFEMIKHIKIRGVSHGDLHSGNILVSTSKKDGKIKLWMIDFGRSSVIPLGKIERKIFGSSSNYFNSRGLLSRPGENRNTPLFEGGKRANVHMANIHYGMRFDKNLEKHINRMRLNIKKSARK
jgi:tRNA A-37 threonylcarbamoyl transferase component Bud32